MSNITEQINILVEVQAVESEILQAGRHLDALRDQAASLDQEAAARETLVADEKKALDEFKKIYRDLESESRVNRDMIVKSNEKLRAVKTNKEYQSSLKEIEDIKLKNSHIEDEMLEFLEQIERAEKDLSERKQRYSQIVDDTNREKDSIKQDTEQCKQKLAQLESDRNVVTDALDSTILDIFYRVKAKQSDGVAIAEVKDAVCQGCNLNIPPQTYIDLQHRNSLKNCPSCERIIYWEDHKKRPE